MSLAKRVLFNGDEELEITISIPESCDNGEHWRSLVEIKGEELNVAQHIRGSDSIDVLLNVMIFIRNKLEQQVVSWVRFPNEGDDWHWFPVICPSFGREFDKRIEGILEKEAAEYCRSPNRRRVNSQRILPDKSSGASITDSEASS